MNLLALVSQWERKVIGERTRDALQHLKAQGKRYCHTVYDNIEVITLCIGCGGRGTPTSASPNT